MASIYRLHNFVVVCFLFLLHSKEGSGLTWRIQPASATGIQGQSVSITWTADLNGGETWTFVKVYQRTSQADTKHNIIKEFRTTGRYLYPEYANRDADINLTASLTGTLLTSVFTMKNLSQLTDERLYYLQILHTTGGGESDDSTDVQLTVLVPPTITSPNVNKSIVTVNETQTPQFVCTATGHPTPSINWTRDGVIVGTGSPYPTPPVTSNDDKACYTCVAYNGVLDAKTASYCLIVQYKPKNATILSDRSTVCQNDKLNLTCTSGPANPAPSGFEFYDNGVLVGTSASNVYEATATAGLPAVNEFVCVPRNLLGPSLENGSVEVTAKVAPAIVTSPLSTTLAEGSSLTLFCNASGGPAPNVTWTKDGGGIVGSTETFTISNVKRADEGSYRCTASNGDECSNVTADANVVVNYPPESTIITTNNSDNTFLKGNNVRLSCASTSKPQLCNVTFYHGNTVIQSYYGKTCAGADAASHVIQSIDGCNLEEYSCKAENQYGQQEAKINLTINVPASINISPTADVILIEGDALQLNCTATGCPTPNITWTKTGNSASLARVNGFFSSHSINSLSKSDTGHYKCSVDNGVAGSPLDRTIYVNVTYKPELTNLTSTKTEACLNDSVTLQCKTNANPPAHEYRFYLNDQLVHTSMSGVYQLNVPQAGNNTYKCEPKNTVGAGQNKSVTIATKAPPKITFSTPNKTVVEGESVVLMCNVTGSDPMKVTWSKVGGSSYPERSSYTFTSIVRDDEATYQCTAHNGNECPAATARSSITVTYKPESTSCFTNKSSNVFLQGETVNLTCQSSAKPAQCNVLFYQGNALLANKSSATCSASHLLTNIQGCNGERLSFKVQNVAGTGKTVDINITVQVPANISVVPSTETVVLEEGQVLSLNCSATGCPTPNITWTKEGNSASLTRANGFFLSHGLNSISKAATGKYKCSVDNRVVGSPLEKTIYVNVTYKPELTNLTSTKTEACLNDSVTLQCTTNANPPAHEYRFYLNDQLVHTSMSGVYQLNVSQAGNNTYKCEPKNTVGAGQNKSVTIATKAPPQITFSTPNKTVVERDIVVLMCNVTGSDPMNVTWSKVGGSSYPEGSSHTFTSIVRGDEATYQCTAHNGNECPAATTRSSITVTYKPENTNITLNKSSNVLLHGEPVMLTCQSRAKPSTCHVLFYQGHQLLVNKSSSTCTASHVISSIQGCNEESFSCFAMNDAGNGERVYQNVTVKVPPGVSVVPSSDTIVMVEGDSLSLSCTPTGCPTPNVTWTKSGVSSLLEQGIGVVLNKTFASLTKQDTGTYQCSVNNGVVGSPAVKAIYLNVTYKPYLTNLTSTKSKACLNDTVTLQCTTNANPPAHEYRFYLNDQLVHTSMSGVYQLNVPQAGNNTYKCEPKNTVGAGQNESVTIATKAPPKITFSTPDQTVVEGEKVVLMCNVTGSDPMNVTWSKVGGSSYPERSSYTFTSIVRDDEATYQCTAHNGNECPAATARSAITVTYPPENIQLSINKSSSILMVGEAVNLTCQSSAKPNQCTILYYQGNLLLADKSSASCTESLVISSVQGCDEERFSCVVKNQAGTGTRVYRNVTVQLPSTISVVPSTSSITKEEGLSLVLNCTATGCPSPNITWSKKEGVLFIHSNGHQLTHDFGGSLGKDDTGTYQCAVDNGVSGSVLNKIIYVNVTYKPHQTNITSNTTNTCVNDRVSVKCISNANPPVIDYSFFLNGQHVHTSTSDFYQFNVVQAGANLITCRPRNAVGIGMSANVSIITKAQPTITSLTPHQTVKERSHLTIVCQASGSAPLNVTLSNSDGRHKKEDTTGTNSLTVPFASRNDEGVYRCTVNNGNECHVVSKTTTATVNYKPENTNLTASKATACVSDELTLTCHTSGKPDPTTYRFYRNDKLIKAQSTNTYKFSTSASGNNVYKCQPENSAGNGTMANVTVIVKAAPVIEYITPSQEVVEGNTLALVCNVTDRSGQSVNVSWHKVGGGQLSSTRTHDIISVGRNDTGSYVCKAHNGNECDAKTNLTIITVKYPATITSHSSLNVTRDENDQITLSCMVSGVPKPSINWTRNDQQIQNAHGETYAFKALESLSGNYSCIVSNGIGGRQQRTFYVKITGHCKGHGCKHGGTCRSEGQSYRCLCTRGLTGRFCENEDPVHTEFDCLLIIVKPSWKDAYGKEDSPEHDDLEKKICSKMFKIFNGGPRRIPGKELVTCILVKARKGSIYANTLLTFNDTALKSEVLNAIQTEIVNKTIFGNLTLKASGLQVSPKSDPCSSEPCKFNSKCEVQGDNGYRCVCDAFRYGTHCEKGIGFIPGIIIILACILIIIIMIILCVLYCKRKKSETYPSGAAENGTSMQTFNVNDHNAAATNAYKTTQDEMPPYRNGQHTEIYRPNEKEEVVYAALSFKASGRYPKKQEAKKFQEKTDTIYADIGSFQQSTDGKPEQDVTLAQEAIELEEKVPIDEKPKQDVTLEQQAIEIENKVPNDANPEPKKETEGGDQNDGSNQTDNDTGGKNEVPESAQTNNNSTSPKDNLV